MTAAPAPRAQPIGRWLLSVGSVYVAVVLLVVLGCIVRPDFLSAENLLQTLKDVSILGIVAVGLCFITLGGHYVDLSIPAIMACSGIVAVYVLPSGFGAALAAGLGMGLALGIVNGLMVGYLRLNPILWTLAAMSLVDGVTRWAYGGKWIYALHDTPSGAVFGSLYAGEMLGVVPTTVVIFAAVAVVGDALLRRTGFGRRLKLTGAAYEAARLSGVDPRRTIMWAFVLSGVASALGGVIKTSFNMYGDVDIGLTYDFQAVTAVVIGGVTLAGGRGSMPGVIGGVLVIGLLGRILPLIPGIGQDQQFIIRGVIFIAVVGISMYALRRSGRSDV